MWKFSMKTYFSESNIYRSTILHLVVSLHRFAVTYTLRERTIYANEWNTKCH